MPENETFWNPYRLVPIRDQIHREAPQRHQRFVGKCGTIKCTLLNLTPLFIGRQSFGQMHPPFEREGQYAIPGSSLKGMLRTLVEIVGGGCFAVQDRSTRVPAQFRACDKVDHLCIACRMFGAMERGSGARVHLGKVCLGDAIIDDNQSCSFRKMKLYMANKGVEHTPFYESPHTDQCDGRSRKLYFHQPSRIEDNPKLPTAIERNAWPITALDVGHSFTFDVQFTNLTNEEFAILLYVLNLEDEVSVTIGDEKLELKGPMRHKIGNGKPFGLGSVEITVNSVKLQPDPAKRFTSLTRNAESESIEGDTLAQFIDEQTQTIKNDTSPTMVGLRKMMVWDPNDPRIFKYPDYDWFQTDRNRNPQEKRRLKKL